MARIFVRLLAAAAFAFSGVASAQSQPPEIERGVAWLDAQVQLDGSLAGESGSMAVPLQARSEAVLALSQLSHVPAPLVASVAADEEALTEFTARRVMALSAATQGASSAIAQLAALRNADGSYGARTGFSGDALDCAFALQAMASTASPDSQSAATTIAWLASAKHADGGWGIDGASDVYVTSHVLLAAQAWAAQLAVAPVSASAHDWLLAQRNGEQRFGSVLADATAMLALATHTAAPDVLQPLADGIRAGQLPDGSWQGDPYLTSLALRALGALSNPPPPPIGASVVGRVVDGATGLAVVGATVQRSDDPGASTTTAADGSFALSALVPGAFELRVLQIGYHALAIPVELAAGQALQLGTVQLVPAPLTADLSGIVRSDTGAALAGALLSVGTSSVLTDSAGGYALAGLDAGEATIQVVRSGYQTISTPVSFLAGQHYRFSPTMYRTGATPPSSATLRGGIVDSETSQPVANAIVAIGSSTVTTANNGRFEITGLAVGAFSLSVHADGFQALTATGTLANGINDVGAIPLVRIPATSTLDGLVSDGDSGDPLIGATLVVVGQERTATTGSDGRYVIDGIEGTRFDLLVTAPGYLSGHFDVALPQPGHATFDLQLLSAQASGLLIDEVGTNKPVYAPSEEIELEVEVRNTTGIAAELVLDADVRDPSGNVVYVFKANVQGAGEFPPNLPLTFPATSATEVEMEWSPQRLVAGSYTVHARGSDIHGRVLTEGGTQFTIRSEPMLRGGVAPSPPLAQAGTSVPVHLSADLLNVGNESVPPGELSLSIVLQNADTNTTTVPQVSASPIYSGSPFGNPRGGVVRDSTGNLLSVNQNDRKLLRFDPTTLAISVLATVPDVPVGVAIDRQDAVWVASSARRISRIDSAGNITSLNAARISSLSGIDVDEAGNLVLSGRFAGVEEGIRYDEFRLVRRTPEGTESLLWRNGLSKPATMVKDDGGNYIVSNYGDNTLSRVTPQGTVTPFAAGFDRPYGMARDPFGNIFVANSGNGTIAKVTPAGEVSTWASGLTQPMDLRFDAAGDLYVSNQGADSIVRVTPDAQLHEFARGVANRPEGMAYDADGDLVIANGDGTLRVKHADGTVQAMTTGLNGAHGIAIRPDGTVFVANYNDGTVAMVAQGIRDTFVGGLSNPYGVAIDGAGLVNVTEYGASRISRFNADGTPAGSIATMLDAPGEVHVDGQGRVFVANRSFITVIEEGVPRVLVPAFAARSIAVDPVHGGLLAVRSYNLYRIALDGSMTLLSTLPFAPNAAVVDGAGDAIVLDYGGRRLQRVDAAGAVSVLSELGQYPADLTADLDGNVYVELGDRSIHHVQGDGSLVRVVHPLSEYIYTIRADATGKLLVRTNYNRVHAIDPTSGTVELLKEGVAPTGLARNGAGELTLSFSGSQELDTYDGSGTPVSRLDGFDRPRGIVWDGDALRFVDQGGRLYAMAPGGYPVKQGLFNVGYLAMAGGELLGTANSTILRWNGTGAATYTTITGTTLQGIAGRPDGSLAAADNGSSRVLELDPARHVTADHAGIVRPQGLAFDGQGRLHVANFGSGTIARLDSRGVASTVTKVASPRYLAFDADANLWITNSGAVTRVTPDGNAGTVGVGVNAMGILIDGADALVADQATSQLRRLSGTEWRAFASGLSNPGAVRAGGGDVVYVANRSSNALLSFANDQLDTLAVNLAGINTISASADGSLLVGRDAGLIDHVALDGHVDNYAVRNALNQLAVFGLAETAAGELHAMVGSGALFRITISQPAVPPAPGTIVHTARLPMPAMAPGEEHEHFDFGDWLPPYGGDFQVVVEREGIEVPAINYVHVGPHATGVLSAARDELPPGDQTLPMCLDLSGADFTAISRVEVDQVRRLASISQPYGMAADRTGNVYYTSSDRLFRTDTQGNSVTLLSGLSTGFGLAADSHENLYFPNRNSSTGQYELVRLAPDATRTTLAELGVSRANGIAVDSHDNVLVGSQGKLFRVTSEGDISVVTTSGLPDPRGIAIDGRDNVYVQNNSGYVSMIRPDGSVSDLYSRNDGVEDPNFEGDGYPNIAADCADNLYIAPFHWDRMGIRPAEEHIITQIVPRTGRAAVLFDTLSVNSIINDIDYLAFDRFGSRLMMYNDYERMIWQVPVTCGAIGVDAHVTAAPGQALSGFTRAPAAVVPQADGRTEYVWSLRDVNADGASVCWDAAENDLHLGELRKSLDSASISFQNSFSPENVTLPLDVPMVRVGNLVTLGVASDRAEYRSFEMALVTATLGNTNAAPAAGVLTIEVRDTQGELVGRVLQQDVAIEAGGELPINGQFPIGTILPGTYLVRATMADNLRALAQAESTFAVLPDESQGLAMTQVATDRQSYQPSDRVTITSRVTSLSTNVILENLTLMVQVRNADGLLLFTQGHPVGQLLPGATRDFASTQLLQNVAAGTFTVRQELLDAAGHVLDARETTYLVGSSGDTGFGLIGSLAADPVEASPGQVVQLTGSATNSGNSDLHGVVLQLAVVDPANEQVLWAWETTADIEMGASLALAQPWEIGAVPAGDHVAVLRAVVGGTERLLAQTSIRVVDQPVVLDATVALSAAPVRSALALVDPGMPLAERDRLLAALVATGFTGTLVETPLEFDTALRTGTFQLYLLLAEGEPLPDPTERLLREAVHRGEGLLVANGVSSLSETLAEVTGLDRSNGLTAIAANVLAIGSGAPGGPARQVLDPPAQARIVRTAGAGEQASIEGRVATTAEIRSLSEALAIDLRIDIAYTGSEAGANGSGLDLLARGRLMAEDGTQRQTAWQVRNSGGSQRHLQLRSSDGSWLLAFDSPAHSDVFIASPVIDGDATHALFEGAQLIRSTASPAVAFIDTRPIDAGDNPGAIALWANATDSGFALDWTGSQHRSYGAVHSNSGIRWSGAQNLVDGPVHHVGDFRNSGSQNTFTITPRLVAPQPLPQLIDIDDYRPGGRVQAELGSAYLDQSDECARKGRWKRNGSNITLPPGVYWIPCDVQLSGSRFSGNVTLVGTGSFQLSGSSATFEPFHHGVQIATSSVGSQAVKLATSSLSLGGLVFAPSGEIEASGSSSEFGCSLVGDTLRLAGSHITIDARQCGYAAIERRAPAVTWHAFGAGWAAYAAFDWSAVLAQVEAGGDSALGELFDGTLSRTGPAAPILRSGSWIPVALDVANHADVFQGRLRLETQAGGTIVVPGVPEWLLDFSQSTTFQSTALVELGSGASTVLTARVAADSPVQVDPLATTTLSIEHVAGESLANLLVGMQAIAERDEALDSALDAVVAAAAALQADEREIAVAELLDAAAYCGRSSHPEADAIRTRIDWVLWRESR